MFTNFDANNEYVSIWNESVKFSNDTTGLISQNYFFL